MTLNKIFLLLIFILLYLTPNLSAQKKEFWWGGGVAYQVPTNLMADKDFGFATVAKGGAGFFGTGTYFYNPQLSLTGDVGYSFFPKDKEFWDVNNYGDVNMTYQMLSATFQGNFYLSEGEVRPYFGALFGFYYLMNKMSFTSNNEISNQSKSYKSNELQPGMGLEFGTLIQMAKKEKLSISLRFSYIPNIESKYLPDEQITINPHGKQNHWGLALKYYFAGKR